MHKKIPYMTLLIWVISLTLIWCVYKGYGLKVNQSESLPVKLFWSKPFDNLKRGMYVSLEHPKFPSKVMCKIVGGIPGDKIQVIEDKIYINEVFIGGIKKTSHSGLDYTPIHLRTVPTDQVFLYATHPESFDSRYEEFGLISINSIKEELWPIF